MTIERLYTGDGVPVVRCTIGDLVDLVGRGLTDTEQRVINAIAGVALLEPADDSDYLYMERGAFALLCFGLMGVEFS